MATLSRPGLRAWHVLALGAALGIASLLLVPLDALAPGPVPAGARVLALVQPAILVLVALWAGARLGPSVGLGAPLVETWLAGGAPGPILKRQLPAALLVGLVTAGILLAYGAWALPLIAADPEAAKRIGSFATPAATRQLYGGITEEVMLRWGLMTFAVWGLWRLTGRGAPPRAGHYIAAILLSALLFGVGHLPLLFALNPNPPVLGIAAVLLANAVPGLLFGWLYWRLGIEATIIAHAFAHLLAILAG